MLELRKKKIKVFLIETKGTTPRPKPDLKMKTKAFAKVLAEISKDIEKTEKAIKEGKARHKVLLIDLANYNRKFYAVSKLAN